MPKPRPLPAQLGAIFSVREAAQAGVARSRLRRGDLERPFRGIRAVPALLAAADAEIEDESDAEDPPRAAEPDPFTLQAEARRDLVRRYAPRLEGPQFISHESAAAMWHAPLPLTWTDAGAPASSSDLTVHVSTFGRGHLIRAEGVSAHRARHRTSRYTHVERIPVADPATTWASLGHLRWSIWSPWATTSAGSGVPGTVGRARALPRCRPSHACRRRSMPAAGRASVGFGRRSNSSVRIRGLLGSRLCAAISCSPACPSRC